MATKKKNCLKIGDKRVINIVINISVIKKIVSKEYQIFVIKIT